MGDHEFKKSVELEPLEQIIQDVKAMHLMTLIEMLI